MDFHSVAVLPLWYVMVKTFTGGAYAQGVYGAVRVLPTFLQIYPELCLVLYAVYGLVPYARPFLYKIIL